MSTFMTFSVLTFFRTVKSVAILCLAKRRTTSTSHYNGSFRILSLEGVPQPHQRRHLHQLQVKVKATGCLQYVRREEMSFVWYLPLARIDYLIGNT